MNDAVTLEFENASDGGEASFSSEVAPIPPDSEALFEQSKNLYNWAQKYWNSSIGQKRNQSSKFNGKTSQVREQDLADRFEDLNSPSVDDEEIDPATNEKTSREKLIIETHELLIEQILSDMAQATKEKIEVANEITTLSKSLSSEDIHLLKDTKERLLELSRSLVDLEIYMDAAKNGVKTFESYARTSGKFSNFELFMTRQLTLYRTELDLRFDPWQEPDQIGTTFARQADTVKSPTGVQAVIADIDENIMLLTAGATQVDGVSLGDENVEPTAPEIVEVVPEEVEEVEVEVEEKYSQVPNLPASLQEVGAEEMEVDQDDPRNH
ncbi:MAG: hypothetical protein WAU07_02945 [Microgenomates group bacterium]